jgi:hypothetical protein
MPVHQPKTKAQTDKYSLQLTSTRRGPLLSTNCSLALKQKYCAPQFSLDNLPQTCGINVGLRSQLVMARIQVEFD